MRYQWILFEAYNDYFTANVMLTKLRSEGFNCMLQDEKTVSIDPILNNAIGGIKLMVTAEQADDIKLWYKVYTAQLLSEQVCPKCRLQAVALNPVKNKSTSIESFFRHLFEPNRQEHKKFICEDCFYSFDEVLLKSNDAQ